MIDDQQRIALLRLGPAHPDDRGPAVQFHLGDHLGSSNVVVDSSAALVIREEFTPYGETSFGSFARKRYRFTGNERDEESGSNYHGARFYLAWLGKWISPDPAGEIDGYNLYAYSRNNPLLFVDIFGTNSDIPDNLKSQLHKAACENASNVHELSEPLDKLHDEEFRLEQQANSEYKKMRGLNPNDRDYKKKHKTVEKVWKRNNNEPEQIRGEISSLSRRADDFAQKLKEVRPNVSKLGWIILKYLTSKTKQMSKLCRTQSIKKLGAKHQPRQRAQDRVGTRKIARCNVPPLEVG
jgi:RHS repeat-associated protein